MNRLALVVAVLLPSAALANPVDLSRAVILGVPGLQGPESQAIPLLTEEVAKRSHVAWKRVDAWPQGEGPVILVGPVEGVKLLGKARGLTLPATLGQGGREGYAIGTAIVGANPVVWVAGNDPRGTLYGVGRLLRELRIERTRVTLTEGFQEQSAPRTPIRGHQIGYRPKTNSYDGWTAAMWEQYLRDQVVFGCNAIELIPPRSDDADDSPHFPIPPLRMMTEVSRLADLYGLDVWIWYPALDKDYSDPKIVSASVAASFQLAGKHRQVKNLPPRGTTPCLVASAS